MSNYTFDTVNNSYFEGRDLRVTRDADGRTILVQRKDAFWGLNVKSEWVRAQRSEEVRTAANNLPDDQLDFAEEAAREFFWREAPHLAIKHGFEGDVYGEGRSGGWLCLGEKFYSNSPVEPTDDEKESIDRWLTFCFEADELRETAEAYFDDRLLEANQNLQIELSEYAGWVGAEVQSLDGLIFKVGRLEIQYGRAALRDSERGVFAVAKESKLVRKADGTVPSRLTADPIMEQVFQIVEARGDVTKEQLDNFLDDEEGNDPVRLYEDYLGPAVREIELRVIDYAKESADAR